MSSAVVETLREPLSTGTTAPADMSILATDETITPDHYWGGGDGTIPVFKPTMEQFRSFPDFIKKIDRYGMKTGIVKVIPPQEWLDTLPELDEKVRSIRVQSAIEQNFAGSDGAFRQMNLEKHRTYSLPQWRKICDSAEHQPPAKRGEARRMGGRKTVSTPRDKPVMPATPPPTTDSDSGSPEPQDHKQRKKRGEKQRHKGTIEVDEFASFDYRIDDNDQYTPERCQDLERSYWKSLTFNNPMYGADLPGSLFDDDIKDWNVAHLDNILNRLGVVLPGVNSAYLYLGMWKASFSWHVEDMDLYSINYIHFGAPKQWYSVSQEDNQKFEKVMKDIFPNDARHCDQFMRHKTFGASPARLAQHDLHVNKLVHYEKEFVITFPYGYHSGYNLGYNCAESVNFATEEWLEYGKVARKCECVSDAVSIDVNDIIKAINGETGVEQEKEEMMTPPPSDDEEEIERKTYSEFDRARRPKVKKRKKDLLYDSAPVVQYKKLSDKYHSRPSSSPSPSKPTTKKIRLSLPKSPCDLCPKAPRYEDVLETDDGHKVHRICAELVPETRIVRSESINTKDHVTGFGDIDKARKALKCIYCKTASGACFQCSSPKCVRAFHGTCAYDAGVLIQHCNADDSDSTYHFLCKTHRPRRPPLENLEFDSNITSYASNLQDGSRVQAQFATGNAFSGLLRENRRSERTLVVEVGNEGDKIEVDYQWILAAPRKHTSAPKTPVQSPPMNDQLSDLPTNDTECRADLARASILASTSSVGSEAGPQFMTRGPSVTHEETSRPPIVREPNIPPATAFQSHYGATLPHPPQHQNPYTATPHHGWVSPYSIAQRFQPTGPIYHPPFQPGYQTHQAHHIHGPSQYQSVMFLPGPPNQSYPVPHQTLPHPLNTSRQGHYPTGQYNFDAAQHFGNGSNPPATAPMSYPVSHMTMNSGNHHTPQQRHALATIHQS